MDEILQEIERDFPLYTKDIARGAGVHDSRIRQFVGHIERADLALKIGREWRFKREAILFVRNRETTILPFL